MFYLFCSVLAVVLESCAVLGRPLSLPMSQLLFCKGCIKTFVVVRGYCFLEVSVLTMVYSSLSTSLAFIKLQLKLNNNIKRY